MSIDNSHLTKLPRMKQPLPRQELESPLHLHQDLSEVIGSKSKGQQDQAGRNDIPGTAEEHDIEALAALEERIEDETNEPLTHDVYRCCQLATIWTTQYLSPAKI